MKKKKDATAADLVQRILNIIERHIINLEEADEELDDYQLRNLPQYLRVILATKVNHKKDENEEKDSLSLLSPEQLMEQLMKEKENK